jgi:hypothetical protein
VGWWWVAEGAVLRCHALAGAGYGEGWVTLNDRGVGATYSGARAAGTAAGEGEGQEAEEGEGFGLGDGEEGGLWGGGEGGIGEGPTVVGGGRVVAAAEAPGAEGGVAGDSAGVGRDRVKGTAIEGGDVHGVVA